MEKSEILEPLHDCLREILDKSDQSDTAIVYTDSDVAAATLMYSQVTGNRLIAILKEERASIGLSQHLANTYSEAINTMTKQMTMVDMNSMYNVKNKNKEV